MEHKIKKFKSWCRNQNISQIDACIDFVKQTNSLDLVTFGFDNISQFKGIITSLKNNYKLDYSALKQNRKKIIDPRLWK